MKTVLTTRYIILLLALCLSFSGCALLPEEDELAAVPILKPYEPAQYNVFAALRGDIERTARLSVAYSPTRSEALSFEDGGILYQEIVVDVGDAVRAGDPVALLEVDDLDNAIADLEWDIEENESARKDRDAIYEHDRKTTPYTLNATELRLAYDKDITVLESEKERLLLKLNQCRAQRERRVLCSGITGVVTYIKTAEEGDLSVRGERVAVITDQTSSAFTASGEYSDRLVSGMRVDVTLSSGVHPATVLDHSAIVAADPGRAYLSLDDASAVISENVSGTVEVVVEERRNIIYIPSKAVQTVREQPYVTMMTNNLRETRDVETGMDNGIFVEIVSGLDEGEEVVY